MARIGEIIDGKYEVLREIGRGGMSVVYLAMDKRLNKQWAIKEFRKDKDDVSKQVALKSLLDEANLMKKLDHPTLPRIVDIIDNHQTVYVIMDYIEGESLNKVLDAYGAQPQEAVIEWAKQLSDVLDYLHTQNPPVIYRDMKPANIMLKPDGTVRLIDFGIAREYKEGKVGDTEAIGTRGYAAPEQFGGKGQTDARTDIYSLGVTLYHLVTGKNPAEPPYEIYPIRHWNPSFSSGLEWLIQKCTQLNPGDRYQSCAEVTYVLENLDKFDTEYKKKKKSRFNIFITSLILTVVFIIASIGLFMGSITTKKNSYDSLIEEKSYISAIEVNGENTLAYTKLAEQLYSTVTKVTPGSKTGATTVGDTVTKGDLLAWFPDSKMTSFRSEHPKEYAEIQFRLGLLMWERYKSGENANEAEVMKAAMPYFERVIAVAQNGNAGKYAGLKEKQFNLAKVFYAVSFFQINRETLIKENAAGETKQLSKIEKFAGIDVDSEHSAYLSFWNTNKEVLNLLNSDADMTEIVKLETLRKLEYITYENIGKFKENKVTADEMKQFIKNFETALNGVSDSEDDYIDEKNEIKNEINTILIPSLNDNYKTEIEEIK